MKYAIIVCLLLCSIVCHSQIKLRTNVSNPSGQEVLVKVHYQNLSKDDYVLFLQNWRIIPIFSEEHSPLGFPHDSKLINFLFISRGSAKAKNNFIPLDWNVRVDSLPTGSFKVIKPGGEFEVLLLLEDSVLVTAINHEPSLDVCLMYSVVELKKVKRLIDKVKASNLFYEGDSLAVFEPAVNHEHPINPARADLKGVYKKAEQLIKTDYSQYNDRFMRQLYCQPLEIEESAPSERE